MPFYFSLQRTNWLKDNHGEAPESSLCLSLNNLLCAKCCTSVATQIYFWQKKGCKYIIILKSNLNTVRIYKSDKFTTPISFSSVQFSSVAQSCPTLWDAINHSTPGLPVYHQFPEFTQTHVHWVGDAIQPSHPLSSPSSPAPNPSQHQGLFQWLNSSHEVAKVLEFQLQHHSLQSIPGLISFRIGWLDLLAVQGTLKSLIQHMS